MNRDIFNKIVSEFKETISKDDNRIIDSMNYHATREIWAWAVPTTDNMPLEQFSYVWCLEKKTAKQYLETLKSLKEKYEV